MDIFAWLLQQEELVYHYKLRSKYNVQRQVYKSTITNYVIKYQKAYASKCVNTYIQGHP